MSLTLLTGSIVKSSHILTRIYSFSKKRSKVNFKVFYYHISISVIRTEKQLSSKTNFSTFLQLNCSKFMQRMCERHWSYQNYQGSLKGVWGKLEAKNIDIS